MKLVVGLGNPGAKYRQTRHNVGFMVLAELASRGLNSGQKPKNRFHADVLEVTMPSGEGILLLGPTTFMNRSGLSVGEAVQFYKLPLDNILIVCDDLNLPLGQLRVRADGSSGGQKGLGNILTVLGTEKIPRLRIGIGAPHGRLDAADFVLMNFTEKEQPEIQLAVKCAADAAFCWAQYGISEAMNRFNQQITKK